MPSNRQHVAVTSTPTDSARGIRKLRQAMADRGFRALPPSAPVAPIGTGRPTAQAVTLINR